MGQRHGSLFPVCCFLEGTPGADTVPTQPVDLFDVVTDHLLTSAGE